MRQAPTHPESQPAALAGTGKGTTHREPRLERRFMAQLRGHKIGPLPGSLLVRRIIPVATTSREIISELTGLEEAVIVRCKKLISSTRTLTAGLSQISSSSYIP